MSIPNGMCGCMMWCTIDPAMTGLTGHHERCDHRKSDREEFKKYIGKLIHGIEAWAAEEDGIPEDLWRDYTNGKYLLGEFDSIKDKA